MSGRIPRILAYVVAGVLGLVVIVLGIAELRWDRTFQAPATHIVASRDSSVIARGRYLAYGPAHCVGCHVAPSDTALARSGQPPLAGGGVFRIPPGTFYARNLTPDSATGIGTRTDEELARMIRYNVRWDGRAAVPFMEFQDLSDEDLTALISFLRSQAPVRHQIPSRSFTLLGKVIMAFVLKPLAPKEQPPARTPGAESAAYGAYLANAVAQCGDCHTKRDMKDGSFIGPRYAGGWVVPVDGDPTLELVTPNLTPDTATGRIAQWNEDRFVARLRAGAMIPQSIMPWTEFGRMTDTDLRAIYTFLRSLPPVRNETGPSLRKRA